MVMSILTAGTAQTQEVLTSIVDQQKAAQVKAVYLYSFGQFTRWPESVSRSRSDFTIGVVGTNLVHDNLVKIAEKRTVADKPIRLKTYASVSEIQPDDCQVLFISSSIPTADIEKLVADLKTAPVLIVTESAHRPDNVTVNFLIEDQAVQVEINNEEAQRKNLAMDARLLRQGRIMQPK